MSLHNDNGCNGGGGGSPAKPAMLGRGISEQRLGTGAGATGILCDVVQIEALPDLAGNPSCSFISGLFSFLWDRYFWQCLLLDEREYKVYSHCSPQVVDWNLLDLCPFQCFYVHWNSCYFLIVDLQVGA